MTATVLHPGVVNTEFGAEDPGPIFKFLVPLMRPFMKSAAAGAAMSIFLASSPDVEGVSGAYFSSSRPKRSPERSYDVAAAGRLWRVSAELVGIPA